MRGFRAPRACWPSELFGNFIGCLRGGARADDPFRVSSFRVFVLVLSKYRAYCMMHALVFHVEQFFDTANRELSGHIRVKC